ncbi:MAG: LamG-like jellyroll fold domain-containing protein [Cyanobacteria bacterium P01_D01_bin.105]
MTIQPKYHWQFSEREGTTTVDSVSNIKATFSKAEFDGHGRIGPAVHLLKKGAHINLGKEVGQFGTSDFTVAFGMKNISSHGDGELDIIGSQSMKGHGNFFSVRLTNRTIFFHVDENSKAKHYVRVKTERLAVLPKRTWFHIAVVREGRKIKIYIDGVLAAEAESKTGIANIKNNTDVKLGHSRRGTPEAQYEDLKIYDKALSANEIQSLLPTLSPRLRAGEAELVSADGAAVLLNQDVDNLHRLSKQFQKLRLGPETGAILYGGTNFESVSQKLYADIPDIRLSRLKTFPASIRMFSTVGDQFTGGQIIETPNGQVKIADNEGQVGELAPGEVALYENVAYHGKTWILSNNGNGNVRISGSHARFTDFQGLNDQVSSVRLGPNTGVTLFKNLDHQAAEANREEEIEDIVKNVPDLKETQIGDDAASSLKIFNTIAPDGIFTSFSSKLSQDYRMVGDTLQEFSSYRTILRFEPNAGEVEVSATDLTEIEVEGATYEIDEVRSVTLRPNALNVIMITSEADGLNTPGLKLRTSQMAPGEQVVIYPNKEAHQQIAELEDGALWNATDAKGNLIVDREAHSKEEVASVQNTIKRVMATVAYSDGAPVTNTDARVRSLNRAVGGDTIDNPWELQFGTVGESKISPSEWKRLRSLATSGEEDGSLDTGNLAARSVSGRRIGKKRSGKKRIGKRFKRAIKKAVSVVIGTVKNVVHVLVKTAKGIIDFVVDTAEKVADFVEAVVDKVVKGIKKFIEFLQFLFNWDDILDTQRYLKKAINASLDSAKQLAEDAKPHVTSFVDDLQGDVEDGMNQLVKALGGKPSEVKASGFEIPEALEWFLSKFLEVITQSPFEMIMRLFRESKPSDAETTSNTENEESPLASFVSQMLEALEDAIGAGLRLSEGVFDSIQTIIANPREPEAALIVIIEALRDAVIQSLDAAENVALGLLDVVGIAIDLFKEFLNAEIRIPFVSLLLDHIGVGKLTVLNLATIVLAIPATVTAKLLTGQNLFNSSTPVPLELVNQQGANQRSSQLAFANVTTASTALSDSTDAPDDSVSTDETDESESLRNLRRDLVFITMVTVADTVNHSISGILDLFDVPGFEDNVDLEFSRIDNALGLASLLIVGPLQALEITSIALSYFSWIFSPPITSEKGTKENNRESVLWSYRGMVLILDTVAMLMKREQPERMRRKERPFNVTWALASAMDMMLASLYLAAVEEENDDIRRAGIKNEIFSTLPNVVCIVRSLEIREPTLATIVHFGHVATDVAAATVSGITGKLLCEEAKKALNEAEAAT